MTWKMSSGHALGDISRFWGIISPFSTYIPANFPLSIRNLLPNSDIWQKKRTINMYIPFDQMPAHARVWVYQAERKLSEDELEMVKRTLERFCGQWNTHGAGIPASFDIRFGQVLILAVDESQLGASGCSIDSSVRTLRGLEQTLQISLLDQGKVSFFKSDNQLEVLPFAGIKSQVASGAIQADSRVLNPTVARKSDLDSVWITKAKDSWLGKFFQN
jgi:hypothetical protein